MLAGLLLPTEGSVWWEGGPGERVELREADRAQVFAAVGVLAQDFPRWEMTAAANVAIGAGDRPRDMGRGRQAARPPGRQGGGCARPDRGPAARLGLGRLQGLRARRAAVWRAVAEAGGCSNKVPAGAVPAGR
ncbi:hypothetical protein ACF1AE_33415 [Streptomyces sp. NPDC014986]|uniref:hypothetical protein n=1 Tax=Streptomyces sp. NPDC014986 TaxID=3364934 RepID=UPI0036FCAFFD